MPFLPLLRSTELLERMAAGPDQYVSALSLLSEAERHQMLYEWNATPREVRSQNSEFRSKPKRLPCRSF